MSEPAAEQMGTEPRKIYLAILPKNRPRQISLTGQRHNGHDRPQQGDRGYSRVEFFGADRLVFLAVSAHLFADWLSQPFGRAVDWSWAYITRESSARLITGDAEELRNALEFLQARPESSIAEVVAKPKATAAK